MRVLLVEDEERLAGAIVAGLGAEGFLVEVARTGAGGLARAIEGEYVAIILDIPIATLRALLEVGLAHPERSEPRALHAALLAETLRLETLAGDMLMLARLDETRAPAGEEVDLDDVVLEEAARARRVPVETRHVAPAKLAGDRRHLLHLVRNLLDNAARYASARVAVTTRADRDGVVLWVDDDGPGIPEADRARVFERFTRSGADRSRETGGAGLGLAVVARVADQHGGKARALDSPLGGARLEVRFPRPSTVDGTQS